jgi:hypothetical protein
MTKSQFLLTIKCALKRKNMLLNKIIIVGLTHLNIGSHDFTCYGENTRLVIVQLGDAMRRIKAVKIHFHIND